MIIKKLTTSTHATNSTLVWTRMLTRVGLKNLAVKLGITNTRNTGRLLSTEGQKIFVVSWFVCVVWRCSFHSCILANHKSQRWMWGMAGTMATGDTTVLYDNTHACKTWTGRLPESGIMMSSHSSSSSSSSGQKRSRRWVVDDGEGEYSYIIPNFQP